MAEPTKGEREELRRLYEKLAECEHDWNTADSLGHYLVCDDIDRAVIELEAEVESLWRSHGRSILDLVDQLEAELKQLRGLVDERDEVVGEWQECADRYRHERDRLKERVAELEESAAMACEEPADDCTCAGCSYAAERNRGGD